MVLTFKVNVPPTDTSEISEVLFTLTLRSIRHATPRSLTRISPVPSRVIRTLDPAFRSTAEIDAATSKLLPSLSKVKLPSSWRSPRSIGDVMLAVEAVK